MTDTLKAIFAHWPELSQSVFVRHTEVEYQLDQLVDEVGNDESRPLASLMEVIGMLVEKYEDEQVPERRSFRSTGWPSPQMGTWTHLNRHSADVEMTIFWTEAGCLTYNRE